MSQEVFELNVGGYSYTTTKHTLCKREKESLLSDIGEQYSAKKSAKKSAYFIDRDGEHFNLILNYMRDGSLATDILSTSVRAKLLKEAQYYKLHELVTILSKQRNQMVQPSHDDEPLNLHATPPSPQVHSAVTRRHETKQPDCSPGISARSLLISPRIAFSRRLANGPLVSYDWEEIKIHNNRESCWLVVYNKVFDVTPFLELHPAGSSCILKYAGTDATRHFNFHSKSAQARWQPFHIGYVLGADESCVIL